MDNSGVFLTEISMFIRGARPRVLQVDAIGGMSWAARRPRPLLP